jgi:hypothetical protein
LKNLALVLLLSVGSGAAAAPTPPKLRGGSQTQAWLRAFLDHDDLSARAEVGAAHETDGRDFKTFGLGGYYALTSSTQLGAFYDRDYGLRHNEDWQSVNGVWGWADTKERGESLWSLDVTQRQLLSDTNWMAEFKLRYIYNSTNNERTLMARPGLSYFYLQGERLRGFAFLQFEMDFALNYNNPADRWLYMGALGRIADKVDIGPVFTVGWQTWRAPGKYRDKGGSPFAVTAQTFTVGLSAIIHWEI